jgi:hypothetical protein
MNIYEIKVQEGFKHRGNAVVASSIKNSKIYYQASKDEVSIIQMANTAYDFMGIFSIIFIQFPNKYIKKMSKMSEGPINAIINKFKKIMKQSTDQAKALLKQFKFVNPSALIDISNILRVF